MIWRENVVRYEKYEKLLKLAMDMQGRRSGISLAEIQEDMGVGRRTAQRMRDAILRTFPQADEVATGERTKRWTIPAQLFDRMIGVSADELAALRTAASVLRRDNMLDQAECLEGVATKLQLIVRPDAARRIEPDLEALLEAEGLAMRPGPRPRLSPVVLETLRTSIKACQKVKLHHRNRKTGRLNRRTIGVLGFLYGTRHYVVALDDSDLKAGPKLFSLANIEKAEPTNDVFTKPADFSLEGYARRSFGVYQESPVKVIWRFKPGAAAEASQFVFHPEQKTRYLPDGSLELSFEAGGTLEMAWHLYKWGNDVEVISPSNLAKIVHKGRQTWPARP